MCATICRIRLWKSADLLAACTRTDAAVNHRRAPPVLQVQPSFFGKLAIGLSDGIEGVMPSSRAKRRTEGRREEDLPARDRRLPDAFGLNPQSAGTSELVNPDRFVEVADGSADDHDSAIVTVDVTLRAGS